MKLIKTWLRSSLSDSSLSFLMIIAIEVRDKSTDNNLEIPAEIWNRKGRRMAI